MYLSRGDCPQRVLKLVRYPTTRFLGEPPTGVKFNIVCVYMCVWICVICMRARALLHACVGARVVRASECVGSTPVVSLCLPCETCAEARLWVYIGPAIVRRGKGGKLDRSIQTRSSSLRDRDLDGGVNACLSGILDG